MGWEVTITSSLITRQLLIWLSGQGPVRDLERGRARRCKCTRRRVEGQAPDKQGCMTFRDGSGSGSGSALEAPSFPATTAMASNCPRKTKAWVSEGKRERGQWLGGQGWRMHFGASASFTFWLHTVSRRPWRAPHQLFWLPRVVFAPGPGQRWISGDCEGS